MDGCRPSNQKLSSVKSDAISLEKQEPYQDSGGANRKHRENPARLQRSVYPSDSVDD
jgi:hypothetical protein